MSSVGSVWRKWDFHVHSPASHGFKGNYEQFIEQLGNNDCALIGINDYCSVAGYKEVMRRLSEPYDESKKSVTGYNEYRAAIEKVKSKKLLPVVEFRTDHQISNKNSDKTDGPKINFHIIFSDKISISKIELFIKSLELTNGNQLGEDNYNNLEFLQNKVSFNYFDFIKNLKSKNDFNDKFFVLLPYNEYGGIDNIDPKNDKELKDGFVAQANILGSGTRKQIDYFLWKSDKFSQEKICESLLGRKIPCLKGSDSHESSYPLGHLKDKDSKPIERFCWVKADPTFEGLRQIITEPEDRCYIGEIPPQLEYFNNNKTKYISGISISKVANAKTQDTWFDKTNLNLNIGLVAIIGNKGSGKSALADVIALSGHTKVGIDDFSFLNNSKFRKKPAHLAEQFECKVSWANDTSYTKLLNSLPSNEEVEKVRYIPQNYFESLCDVSDKEERFIKELEKVIFSRIPESERLGTDSLKALIDYKTSEILENISNKKAELRKLNIEISDLEVIIQGTYKQTLIAQIAAKKEELDAIIKVEPQILTPSPLSKEQEEAINIVTQEITKKTEELNAIDLAIEQEKNNQASLVSQIAHLTKADSKVSNFKEQYATFENDLKSLLEPVGLKVEDIASLSLKSQIIADKLAELYNLKKISESILDTSLGEELVFDTTKHLDQITSLYLKRKILSCDIDNLRNKLDEPNKRYQKSLEDHKIWTMNRNKIMGSAEKREEGSIVYLQDKIDEFAKLPQKVDSLREQQFTKSLEIFGNIKKIKDIYISLYQPVQQVIANNSLIKEHALLNFDSSIVEKDFTKQFFDIISHGSAGSFCGIEQGMQRLNDILEDSDFSNDEGIKKFIQNILANLSMDKRKDIGENLHPLTQLKKDKGLKELYDFIFSLDYLKPEYSLQLASKELSQLSPGERGVVLLIFYLFVEQEKIPIIIDQPEENLDNNTVFSLLVPLIKGAKKERQVIMVTHNPNIAVVCDAEQIIHASMDKANKNTITYISGAIESPELNKCIVDVLEGTRPAFDNRDAKYFV